MAFPKPISDVWRELEARYEWDPALTRVLLDSKVVNVRKPSDFMYAFAKDASINAIFQAASFVDLAAMGQVSRLRQAIIVLKKAEAETSLQRKGWLRSTMTSRWTLLCSRS